MEITKDLIHIKYTGYYLVDYSLPCPACGDVSIMSRTIMKPQDNPVGYDWHICIYCGAEFRVKKTIVDFSQLEIEIDQSINLAE